MAEDEPPRVVATFDSYAGMLEAIRARVHELQVNGERLDEYVGLPRGYYSKVAGARPIRRLGMTSFAPILNGLGLKCQFIEDPIGTERLKSRVPPPECELRKNYASSHWHPFHGAHVETYSAARRHGANGEADARTAQRVR